MVKVLPAAGLAPHGDLAAVVADGVLDDREAETGAAGRARPGRIDAVEALEDPLLLLLGDPDALVGHGDLDDIRRGRWTPIATRVPSGL